MQCCINAIFTIIRTNFRCYFSLTILIIILTSNLSTGTKSSGNTNLLEADESDEQTTVALEYDVEAKSDNAQAREQINVQLAGESYQGQYNNLSQGCSTRCSITSDKSLRDCWLSTLTYFERVVVGLLRRFVTVQTNRMIWEYKHEIKSDFAKTESESINRLSKRPTLRIRDANRAFTTENIREIVHALFHDIEKRVNGVMHGLDDPPPTLECPRACEKRSPFILWLPLHCWLFIISCTLTVALATFIIVAIFILERRESKITKNEIQHYGDTVSASVEPTSATTVTTTSPTSTSTVEVKITKPTGTTKTTI